MKYRQAQTLVVGLALLAFGPMLIAQDSRAQTTFDVNTGNSHPGVYPYYTADGYWKVVDDPDGGTSEPRPAWTIEPHPAWAAEMTGSRWISAYPDYSNYLNGTYVFEFCFYLDPYSFSGATIDFDIRADDSAVVYLNGTAPANWIGKADWYSWNATTFPTPPNVYYTGGTSSLFQTGNNVITVVLVNTNAVAMGFNIDGTITTDAWAQPGCWPATGAIQGMKWDDGLIPNCVKDGGEPVLQGWEINLSNGDKAWTDIYGNYYFYYLLPGIYTVIETQQTGWIQYCPYSASYEVSVGPNQTITGLDFGNRQNDTLGSIEGYKFNDYDCDGEWDFDEPGIEDWGITLWQGNTPLMSMLTDAGGHYIFSPLDPGTYGVSEHHDEPGFQQTHPFTVNHRNLDLQMGQHLTDYNFGNNDTCDEASVWDTLLTGGIDDFLDAEPSHWGEGLSEYMSGVDHIDNFDEIASNQYFGYTYEHNWSQCCIKSASLTITLKATSGGSFTDALSLGHYGQGGTTVWWIYMSDLYRWARNDEYESWDYGDYWTFTLNLADLWSIDHPSTGVAYGHGYDGNILAALKKGYLDLLIQDDTGCDWLEWRLEVCCPHCCDLRGDINHDGVGPDIADLVYLVIYMFQDGPPPVCSEPYLPDCPLHYYSEADVNGDGTCVPDIADVVYLVTYMFQGGPALVPCP